MDIFSDGSPAAGQLPNAGIRAAALEGGAGSKRVVPPNPPAALVHAREADAPWRVGFAADIARANEEALAELRAKRVKRLGLDVSQGIKANFGIHVEFSTIANIAEVALRHAQSAKPPRVSLEVRKHLQCADADEQSVAERLSLFLKRVMRYDLAGVLECMGIAVPCKPTPYE